jgi:hypothetical protein
VCIERKVNTYRLYPTPEQAQQMAALEVRIERLRAEAEGNALEA